jgi:NTE family protein
LNRDPRFIKNLISHGETRAEEFLIALAFEDAWRNRDYEAVMGFFAGDAELVSSPPFPDSGVYRGKEEIHRFLQGHMGEDVYIDLTKKQVARNRVIWAGRVYLNEDSSAWAEGTAEAEFRGEKIKFLHLGNSR